MDKVLPTRIVVTETEETYYQIKVVVGEKIVVSNMEVSGIDHALGNKAWVRENFMYDIPKLDDRIYFAGILQEMIQIISDSNRDIIQIVYETETDRYPTIRSMGFTPVMSEKSGISYHVKEYDSINTSDTGEVPMETYENISTDVEHVKNFFEFHTKKITTNQLNKSDDHIVNLDDIVLFLGFNDASSFVHTFNTYNYIMKLDNFIVNNTSEIDEVISNEEFETCKFILAVNNDHTQDAIEAVKKHKDKFRVVVYDTEDDYESLFLMSICKRHGVLLVKRMQHSHYFNFGVFKKYELCADHADECNNGVITLNDNVWVGDRAFVVFMDPRYADITRVVSAMELCKDVWTITVIHDIVSDTMDKLYEYKFMPVYQSEQIMHVTKIVKSGLTHTPIAFFTRFPAIAKILFESSVFVSCKKDHLLEYIENVTNVFKKSIKDHSIAYISKINDAKSLAFQMVKKMDFVKEAQQRARKKKVVYDINEEKIRELLKSIKINH